MRYGIKPADLDEMTHNEIAVYLDDLNRYLREEAKRTPIWS